MNRSLILSLALTTAAGAMMASGTSAQTRPHNVILFVADGLRSAIVSDETAPVMASIRREGVDFHNSHALYPTVTTVNGSAIATGHRIGDTGDFGNTIWVGAAVNRTARRNSRRWRMTILCRASINSSAAITCTSRA